MLKVIYLTKAFLDLNILWFLAIPKIRVISKNNKSRLLKKAIADYFPKRMEQIKNAEKNNHKNDGLIHYFRKNTEARMIIAPPSTSFHERTSLNNKTPNNTALTTSM